MLAKTPSNTRRFGSFLAGCALTLGLLTGPLALPAYAEGTASNSPSSTPTWTPTEHSKVSQVITFGGAVPPQLSQKFETREDLVGDRQYVQTISDVTASVGGASVTPDITSDDRFTTVTLATNGATEVTTSRHLRGAVVNTETARRCGSGCCGAERGAVHCHRADSDSVHLHQVHRRQSELNRALHLRGSRHEIAQVPTFKDGLREGEVVAVDIGFLPGTVAATEVIEYRWTIGRAFSAAPLQLGFVLGCWCSAASACSSCTGVLGRHQCQRTDQQGWRVRADRPRTERVPGRGRHSPGSRRHRGRRAGRPDRRHRDPVDLGADAGT